ncbi:MAG: GntR family transcriptional regulator [Desulfovibrio aminophilus]|uniref:GntR family transcriptional regulator n=1 Tax=Desulfovibrio aminophilus TaxID=81425 RepID=UPI0039EA517D
MTPRQVAEQLKQKIIMLELPPETILNISELALQHGVSRTPVKEALIVLQAEEWVQRHGSHFMVTPLSLERIKQITEIRSILEVESNLLALRRMDEATRRSFDSLRVRINGLDSSATNLDIVNADLALHRRLYTATRNTQLTKVLDHLLSHYLRFWLSLPQRIELDSFFDDTLGMIAAVVNNDEKALRKLSEHHVARSADFIVRIFLA